MKRLVKLYYRIPPFFRNKYSVTIFSFFIWMLFFDDNNFYAQYKLKHQLNELREKKEYFKREITQVNSDKNDLLTNQATLEKFAREKYWMKRENEDLFVIVEK